MEARRGETFAIWVAGHLAVSLDVHLSAPSVMEVSKVLEDVLFRGYVEGFVEQLQEHTLRQPSGPGERI